MRLHKIVNPRNLVYDFRMGTRVDFYILSTTSDEERLLYACRLIEKVFHKGEQIYVHTNDQAQANKMDQLLWSFRDTSFVPHTLVGNDRVEKVMIGYGGHQSPLDTCIWVNLSEQMPLVNAKIKRIVEILPKEGPVTLAGRARYRTYQQQQFELNTHKIGDAS